VDRLEAIEALLQRLHLPDLVAEIEAAKTAIANARRYYTPDEIIDFVSGSANYLGDILENPPYAIPITGANP